MRDFYAMLPESRERGYKPGRFSFNVSGGRCEACQGEGQRRIEMNFLPDVYVQCEVCGGHRYNHETLSVRYNGYSIADLLEMPVSDVLQILENIPQVRQKLQTLVDVGLGYIHLGQSAVTLSGGEAQRIKLARELSKRQTGKTLYLLDEPTTGLHFDDVTQIARRAAPADGSGQHGDHHRAQPGRDPQRRLDHRPRPRRRRRRRTHRGAGHPEQVARVKKSYTGQELAAYFNGLCWRNGAQQWKRGARERASGAPSRLAGIRVNAFPEDPSPARRRSEPRTRSRDPVRREHRIHANSALTISARRLGLSRHRYLGHPRSRNSKFPRSRRGTPLMFCGSAILAVVALFVGMSQPSCSPRILDLPARFSLAACWAFRWWWLRDRRSHMCWCSPTCT